MKNPNVVPVIGGPALLKPGGGTKAPPRREAKELPTMSHTHKRQEQADDDVIATGETWSVRTFAEKVFERLDMPLDWEGSGEGEKGIDRNTGRVVIQVDPRYFRPAEVDLLLGDPSKARRQLGWELKTSFDELVSMMVAADLELAEREKRADG